MWQAIVDYWRSAVVQLLWVLGLGFGLSVLWLVISLLRRRRW